MKASYIDVRADAGTTEIINLFVNQYIKDSCLVVSDMKNYPSHILPNGCYFMPIMESEEIIRYIMNSDTIQTLIIHSTNPSSFVPLDTNYVRGEIRWLNIIVVRQSRI